MYLNWAQKVHWSSLDLPPDVLKNGEKWLILQGSVIFFKAIQAAAAKESLAAAQSVQRPAFECLALEVVQLHR